MIDGSYESEPTVTELNGVIKRNDSLKSVKKNENALCNLQPIPLPQHRGLLTISVQTEESREVAVFSSRFSAKVFNK